MIKLDLGAGDIVRPGFIPLGHGHGTEIYPLPYADESVDEIVCSHALEHFPHGEVGNVLHDWTRALKKGGKLRISVPDFSKIAQSYLEGRAAPHQAWVLGGQTDPDDYHKAMFDRETLRGLLAKCGLVLIQPWTSEIDDCAALDISLNLEARKPFVTEMRVSGAMSVPRLGFTDNMFCAIEAALACQVKFRKHGGVFWGQSLTKVFERIIEEDDPEAILTVDYDSIFSPKHLAHLMQLMMLYPEADAIAPIQSSRHLKTTLFTVQGPEGDNAPELLRTAFDPDLQAVETAHFGLTLIRTEKLKALPKPWFHSVPGKDGEWGDGTGSIDEDIAFWRKWKEAGNNLFLANRVAIGHAELQVRWPDINLEVFHQSMTDWQTDGAPEGVWQ